ncbi:MULTISPECIES: hypothetical protein [unclassified Neisseria]|uniref:hypothetical protein n=1 Tax=unclassified Neisseria TaxID=2623750 RepID=UPI001072CA24|nr:MULTISPECIES: hypothetical protein [unclassified Neisseria]MBF0805017.1 hypothetical protein [Neisseria sp. 19428wB4_WF04]TFU39239.1 hypothetical protein E4T99_12120 [Neisseria sp. WF04]
MPSVWIPAQAGITANKLLVMFFGLGKSFSRGLFGMPAITERIAFQPMQYSRAQHGKMGNTLSASTLIRHNKIILGLS